MLSRRRRGRSQTRQVGKQGGAFTNAARVGHPDIDPLLRQFPDDSRRVLFLVRDHEVRRHGHNRIHICVLRSPETRKTRECACWMYAVLGHPHQAVLET